MPGLLEDELNTIVLIECNGHRYNFTNERFHLVLYTSPVTGCVYVPNPELNPAGIRSYVTRWRLAGHNLHTRRSTLS
ncbi:hypothetical protein ElyMa_000855000 [Elysia marginata]|uniref:Uncharacterized protein n=1 Tax=Elysia marginata TaxID=1093978 RepID=A0AAV4H2Q1_9GAST|nr:hypothetical protein ElyMa_000855000 [Elysia marginata]